MKNGLNKEEYDVLPDDLLQDIALLKGCAAPLQGVPVAASILYPVSTAFAAEERRKEEEALKNAPQRDSDYFKVPKVIKK